MDIFVAIDQHELIVKVHLGNVVDYEAFEVDPLPVGVTAWLNILEKLKA